MRPLPPISATWARIDSTGRRARPTTCQEINATTASTSGSPTASSICSPVMLSETASSEAAANTRTGPEAVRSVSPTTR